MVSALQRHPLLIARMGPAKNKKHCWLKPDGTLPRVDIADLDTPITLVDGEWIDLANSLGIGWWMTSALESNIGLNAIAQLASTFENNLPQGLGTGQLYENNFDSPLVIEKGNILYKKSFDWGI
jgi:hypothetical protein